MRIKAFCIRTAKEIIREPLNIFFGLAFPIILLLLLSAIQQNVPVELFKIEHLAPAVVVFGLSFMTLFSATLISKDRQSALLQRLYTTPIRAVDFIIGYSLPILVISMLQAVITFIASFILGLDISINIIISLILVIPTSILFIGLGLLCGSIFNDKQVGGICGALLTNLTAWLSGAWFDIELVGGAFKVIAEILPFYHAVEMMREIVKGIEFDFMHLVVVMIYGVTVYIVGIIMFIKQMRRK